MTDAEFDQAKAYIMQASTSSGLSVFDQLSDIVNKLLDEKPENAADRLEAISYSIKASKFTPASNIKEQEEHSDTVQIAKTHASILKHDTEIPEEEDEPEHVVPDLMEAARFFESADVGLGMDETFRIFLALKQLAEQQPLKSCSLWGKIFGLERNYIIAEAEYREGEEPQVEGEDDDTEEAMADEGEEGDGPPPLPKSLYKPPPTIPSEEYGSGTNKKIYFVCNEPGEPWVLLPSVTPAHISVARSIKKRFTGRLDTPIVSYPPFPGTEAELLRAQIARITAGTHISPVGFYTFDEEEEAEDEERENFIVDEEFEGKTLGELMEADLSGWAHHAPYILPQGRCRWVNPVVKDADDVDEDDEDEEEEDEVEPETGLPLLTPLQNDEEVDGLPAWTTRLSSNAHPAYACVRISSNRWPGAHAYAVGRKFGNVYIGNGIKYQAEPFSPQLPALPLGEYAPPETEEEEVNPIAEAVDPTREEEEEFEAQQAEENDDGEDEEED